MIEILLALIAGVLTIAAPCILLPLPILLGSSVGQKSRTRPLFITLGFVITFSLLGIGLNVLVQNLDIDPTALRTIAVILLALFALFLIWPTPFEKLTQHMSGLINRAAKTGKDAGTGNWGGFVMGVVIGIVWAPCAGPILGSILTLIAQERNLAKAFALLIAYAIGAGIPMLGIAYGGQAITTKVRAFARYATRLQQIFGVILLLLAAAIYFQYDTYIQAKIITKFPQLNGGLESRIYCKFDFYVPLGDECEEKERTPTQNQSIRLHDYGSAPEFTGISNWLNTDTALTLSGLKGKIVLVDFWTYSCINCVRTLPYIAQWHDKYKDNGLVVVGIHTPEFAFEKDTANVKKALQIHDIRYAVAQDNDYRTWTAYKNRYWPAKYLLDADGKIVYTHFGEGAYTETEQAIRTLLGLEPTPSSQPPETSFRKPQTPEIYFGLSRLKHIDYATKPTSAPQEFVIPNRLDKHKFALQGTWQFDNEKATLVKGPGKIKLHFQGSSVYMVTASKTEQSITTKVDSFAPAILNVKDHTLYTVFDSTEYGDHVLEISIPEAGFEAYTFTFAQ